MRVPVIKAGNRYEVVEDSYNNFMSGEIVIALESDEVPYCVKESIYCKDRSIRNYPKGQVAPLLDTELKEIQEG